MYGFRQNFLLNGIGLGLFIQSGIVLVLDFFAGSGTTAHSLLLLNKEDNGNRKFILCTNNENQIAEKICYERVKNVILGNKEYASITNIPANLKYYKSNIYNI